jgi:hypothetical protein
MAAINNTNYPRFLNAYEQAIQAGQDSFVFDDQEVLVGYAKYVIECLEGFKARSAAAAH